MKKIILSGLSLLSIIGCSDKLKQTNFEPADQNRITYFSHRLTLSNSTAEYTHIATIAPHSLNNNLLQATGFEKDGSFAYIVYNTKGDTIRGGLDIVSLSSLNTPVLVSSLVSENSEYAEVKRVNNLLFMVGQKKDIQRNYGLLTVVDVTNKSNPVVVSEKVFTDGWYATSLDIEGSKAFITVPNVGVKEIDISNPLNLTEVSSKLVKGNSLFVRRLNGNSIVLGGTGTHELSKLSGTTATTLMGLSSLEQEAPSRFHIKNNIVLTNAGYTGLKIVDINNSPILKSTTNLVGRGNGVTQGSCNLAYLAQGEQGLLSFDIQNLTTPINLGQFDFADDSGSANNVFYMETGSDKYIFVADGLGGVKIVKVQYSSANCGNTDGDDDSDDDSNNTCNQSGDDHNSGNCDQDDDHGDDDDSGNTVNNGLFCKVYDLSSSTPSVLPNFGSLTPVGSFVTNSLNVPAQTWENSFPLFPNYLTSYKEWYGIVCEGKWKPTATDSYLISLSSDDGSKFYLNNNLEIDNDGTHAPLTKTKSLSLNKDQEYGIKVEYFQGPKVQIQLELKVKQGSSTVSNYMSGFTY